MRRVFAGLCTIAWSCLAPAQSTPSPLDLLNPATRDVLVRVETSTDLATVGQTFGPELPATYSAAGNVGTLVIPATSHEQMVDDSLPPVPGSYTAVVVEFDLTTFDATAEAASGANASGGIAQSFLQHPLDTATIGGFVGPASPPLFCSSQADVDAICAVVPGLCGQTCTIVPGNQYDPATGLVNLIGIETLTGCDGSFCQGPVDFFASRGDLMLTEASATGGGSVSGGGGNGGACFIATAAHGTPLAEELDSLRAVRDRRLLPDTLGAAFTDSYYRLSPTIADAIAQSSSIRAVIRTVLRPIIRLCRAD